MAPRVVKTEEYNAVSTRISFSSTGTPLGTAIVSGTPAVAGVEGRGRGACAGRAVAAGAAGGGHRDC